MKITFRSEDYKDGLEVDWPSIPRVGEFVTLVYSHGSNKLKVDEVNWACNGQGEFLGAEVHLSY